MATQATGTAVPSGHRAGSLHLPGLLLSVLAVVLVAGVGSAATRSNQVWFDALERPPATPPGWVFGPVWTSLYLAMAVAAWLVWRTGPAARGALVLYVVQLTLNGLWSPVFFGAHAMGLGLAVIVALDAAVLATIVAFARRRRAAAALLLPYLTWVGYATYLNAGFLILNR